MNERLYRSRDERIIAGVAGGVAHQFHMDPSLVRILWVILVPLTGGVALGLYIVMAFVVPEEPAGDARWAAWGSQSGGYQWPDAAAAGGSPAGAGASSGPPAGVSAGAPGAGWPSGAAGGGAAGAAGSGAAGASSAGAGWPSGAAGAGSSAAAGSSPSSAWVSTPTSPTPGMTPPTAPVPSSTASPNPPWPGDWRSSREARREARRAERAQGWDGSGAILFGLILIVVGGYFFARAYLPDIDVNRTWPILLVVLGALLLVGSLRRGSNRTP